jgi:hypothetical protein
LHTKSITRLSLGGDGLEDNLDTLFDRFEQAFEAAKLEAQFTTAQVEFLCRTDLPLYRDIVKLALASKSRSDGDRCRIVVAKSGTLGMPHLRWCEPFYQEREVESRLSATRYRMHYFTDLDFWQFYDQQTARGIQLMREPEGYPDWDPGSPLRNFLHWHLGARGMGLLHAGTLAVDGVGVMLAGPGKSGKSGTVLAGVVSGLSTVGDDYVLADITNGVKVMPLFNTVKLDPDGIKRLNLETNTSIPAAVNWQGKHHFTLADIADRAQVSGIDIRALCLPHITGGAKTRLRRARVKDAFLALAPSGVAQIPGDRTGTFAFCANVVRNLPCYHLDLGAEPTEITAFLRSFIMKDLT